MTRIFFTRLLIGAALIALLTGDVQAQGRSSSLSCPPDYALSIDPPPQPSDDPANPDTYKPQSAAEKQQAEQQAKADELARWHCVPLASIRNQQEQQAAGGSYEQ
jgi:hypothetical protein